MRIQPAVWAAIAPVSKTAAATATGAAIDCIGFRYASICVQLGTADVVSNKPTVLKLQESATTDSTNFADISGAIGGTDFTVANANTSIDNLYLFQVDLRKRKRYLRAVVSPATTQICAGVALLTLAEQAPITAAKAHAAQLVEL